VQDTGFGDWLTAPGGVVPFRTPEEARAGVADIERRYEHHAREARITAAEYFDANKVLPRLLDQALRR
jgi:hypothetical protein